MPPPRLLLFDPHHGGHHAEYVRHLLRAWTERGVEGRLVAALSSTLLASHPELAEAAFSGARSSVEVDPLDVSLHAGLGTLRIGRENGRLLRETVGRHRPERTLLMYLDSVQPALALGLRLPSAAPLSGILFRPSLHYGELGGDRAGLREGAKHAAKRVLLRRALRNPHVATVFSLDPTAVPRLQREAGPRTAVRPLADPVPIGPATRTRGEMRRAWGVEPGRRLAVLFGSLEERKGLFVLLEALLRLPATEARRLAVVIAGPTYPDISPRLDALAAAVRARGEVQVLVHDGFVPSEEAQAVVAAADVILVPYLRHIGSSNVLIRAAAAGVPVLSQRYGLMGHLVRTHALGRTVDPADVEALAGALAAAVRAPDEGFDPVRAADFAASHTAERFVDALFEGNGIA